MSDIEDFTIQEVADAEIRRYEGLHEHLVMEGLRAYRAEATVHGRRIACLVAEHGDIGDAEDLCRWKMDQKATADAAKGGGA